MKESVNLIYKEFRVCLEDLEVWNHPDIVQMRKTNATQDFDQTRIDDYAHLSTDYRIWTLNLLVGPVLKTSGINLSK